MMNPGDRSLLQLVACVAALWATAGCQGARAPAAVPDQVLETNARSSGPESDVRRSRPLAAAPGESLQFDLECTVQGRVVSRGRWGGGSPYLERWSGDRRLSVDLVSMQFCEPLWCSHTGPKRLVDVDDATITFYDHLHDGVRTIRTLDRRDGRYMQRITSDDGWDRLTTGVCHRRSFSGFPEVVGRNPDPAG